jgi:hypothetical protein
MKTRKFKVVEISWYDAEVDKSGDGWSDDDPGVPLTLLKTYGILVRTDADWVVHASTFDPDTNRYSERGKIPRGMVKEIRELCETEIELPAEAA